MDSFMGTMQIASWVCQWPGDRKITQDFFYEVPLFNETEMDKLPLDLWYFTQILPYTS